MNILLNCPLKFDLKSQYNNKLGGIESLNIELAKILNKKKFNVTISSECKKEIKINKILNLPINTIIKKRNKFNFDYIISSNDAKIFKYFRNVKKIIWLHNKLQIEKAIRKRQLISIIKSNSIAVFVSNFLEKNTSNLYLFKKRIVINNFITHHFLTKKINYNRKPIFVWSIQREKGLDQVIDIWIKNVFSKSNTPKFYIYGTNKFPSKKKIIFYKSKNIFFKGRVNKLTLKKIYTTSMGMICPGYDETFCLNAIEANACGLPVITFGYTALKELIINDFNGYIVKNYNQLSQKINFMVNTNDNNRKKLINNSFRYSKKFNINNIILKWLSILKLPNY